MVAQTRTVQMNCFCNKKKFATENRVSGWALWRSASLGESLAEFGDSTQKKNFRKLSNFSN